MKITHLQTQKQILAPSMQQSIEVLLLPVMGLHTAIEQEMENNPLLEVEEHDATSQEDITEELQQRIDRVQQENELPFGNTADDETFEERPIKKDSSLEDRLLVQLRIELSDPLALKIGEFIIGNIDENGYLKVSCEEIAHTLGIQDMDAILHVLHLIQNLEPPGIASRDLKECLLIQIKDKIKDENNAVYRIIQDYLPLLGKKKYSDIAKKLGVSLEEVKEAARFISALEPMPARNSRPLGSNIYINPDAFITLSPDGEYQILLNEKGIPRLRISPIYKDMLKKKNIGQKEKEFIREKMTNALYFIKSIEQRSNTINGIVQYIIDKQKDFFENGHLSLVPMNLKDVAQALNRNESTISRAVNNKYIDTPQGLLPMKFFFSQAVGEGQMGVVSNRSIKEEIKSLIEAENKSSPLADQDIQKYFEKKGMKLARRTISKYRQALRILPSHLRKE